MCSQCGTVLRPFLMTCADTAMSAENLRLCGKMSKNAQTTTLRPKITPGNKEECLSEAYILAGIAPVFFHSLSLCAHSLFRHNCRGHHGSTTTGEQFHTDLTETC